MRRLACLLTVVALGACTRDFTLSPRPGPPGPGRITGRVFVAAPGTGEKSPAKGVLVTLLRSNLSTRSRDNGFFELEGITSGEGQLLLQLDENGDGAPERQKLVDLQDFGAGPGHDADAGELLMRENAAVKGRVRLADKAGNSGLGGTVVFVPEGPFTATTGDDGSFTLAALPDGKVTLGFFHAGYAAATAPELALRGGETLTLSERTLEVRTGPAADGKLSGQVVLQPAGDPAGTAVKAEAGGESRALDVGADGSFSGSLAAGIYQVRVSRSDYGVVLLPNVFVPENGERALGQVVLAQGSEAPPEMMPADAGTPADAGSSSSTVVASVAPVGEVATGSRVTLDATASHGLAGKNLVFSWSQLSGDQVFLDQNDSTDASRTTFTAPSRAQMLSFRLLVFEDGGDGSAEAIVNINVVSGPVARATAPIVAAYGQQIQLDGSGSTAPANAPLKYSWTQKNGEPVTLSANDSPLAATPTFTVPGMPDTVTFDLVVTDLNTGLKSAAATVSTLVTAPPQAKASPAQVVVAPGTVFTLDGSDSSDPTGSKLTYEWTVPPQAGAVSPGTDKTAKVTLTAAGSAAELDVKLVVANKYLTSAPAFVHVKIDPAGGMPSVSAGPDQHVGIDTDVQLKATATHTDPSQSLTYLWTQTAGPAVTLTNATGATAGFHTPVNYALLTFRVTVKDGKGATASDDVDVEVQDTTAPTVTSTVPGSSGTGSPFFVQATFSEAVEPTSVNANSVYLTLQGSSTPLGGEVRYDAATRTATLVPAVLLSSSASYSLHVDGIKDFAQPPNVSTAYQNDFTVRGPVSDDWTWTTFSPSTKGAAQPGVAVVDGQVYVSALHDDPSCAGEVALLTIGTAGSLTRAANPCVSSATGWGKTGRRGFVYEHQPVLREDDKVTWLHGGAWTGLQPPVNGVLLIPDLDGTALYAVHDVGTGAPELVRLQPSLSWGNPEAPFKGDSSGWSGGEFAAGASQSGRFVLVSRIFENSVGYFLAAMEKRNGTWVSMPSTPGATPEAVRPFAFSNILGRPRVVFANREPVILVASTVTGGPSISAVQWRSTNPTWLDLPAPNGASPASVFDVVGRGAELYAAYVTGTRLYLRRLDTSQSSPKWVDVPGASGPEQSVDSTCQAEDPELYSAPEGMYLTWAELCPAGPTYHLYLRRFR